jgi:hypothetical protein
VLCCGKKLIRLRRCFAETSSIPAAAELWRGKSARQAWLKFAAIREIRVKALFQNFRI